MKKLLTLFAVLMLFIVGCGSRESTADEIETSKQSKITKAAAETVGMPNIVNFTDKLFLKRAYEARDDAKLTTYTYVINKDGKAVFLFKSHGYGIPYATQFSNPQVPVHMAYENWAMGPQAEPNGLYMPASSEGTWIMAVDTSGNEHLAYVEERIMVLTEPLESFR